ncbi:peroxidase-like [Homarus americanus]|uniref:peroxidase-like n=1 Tax=Homarus americanus TaxID=6706 RepID=UPI001C44B0B1|nr:peroxidase-like [Homarus americanus]XP_042209062.1 peroxidase-like [Homarus americanus]XP_042209063.1 peroxidase-like [Homarus americanus]XP_042209064.1 peroxidase-like [Homarus americanus]
MSSITKHSRMVMLMVMVTVTLGDEVPIDPQATCEDGTPLYLRMPHHHTAQVPLDASLEIILDLPFPRHDNVWFQQRWSGGGDGGGLQVSDRSTFAPGDPYSWDRTPQEFLDVTPDIITEAFKEGVQAMSLIDELEMRLYSNNITVDKLDPSWKQDKLFHFSNELVRNLSRFGHIASLTTIKIKSKVNMLENKTSVDMVRLGSLKECEEELKHLKPSSCDIDAPYRTSDGTCNNLKNPTWGASFTPFRRLLPAVYGDGVSAMKRAVDGEELPNPRHVSNSININKNNQSACFSILHMTFGQFLDHDLTATPTSRGVGGSLIPCCLPSVLSKPELKHPECAPIFIPPDDEFYPAYGISCLNLVRSSPAHSCSFGPREQLNTATGYIDGSAVYGSTKKLAKELRVGRDGLLDTQVTKKGEEMLPASKNLHDGCNVKENFDKKEFCFKSGDFRVNEQMMLMLMTTLWARQHNNLARQLKALNPSWDDEKLYQEARRINVAMIQNVAYKEFICGVLGRRLMEGLGLMPGTGGRYSTDYDPAIPPSIANEFAAAVYRFGHSMITSSLLRVLDNGEKSAAGINSFIFSPFESYRPGATLALMKGGMLGSASEVDHVFSREITGKLFKRGNVGLDLVAINIQRGRDHGLAGYVTVRQACGLRLVKTFNDLAEDMNSDALENLKRIYKNVRDIDLFVGGLSENPLPGSQVGPTFACVLVDQFVRLKKGDRYWFENKEGPGAFTKDQLRELQQVSLARVMCDNMPDMSTMQRWPLLMEGAYNPELPCSSKCIPSFNISHWKA